MDNRLAAILEASLKKENLIEPEIPQAPLAPKGSPVKKVFKFSETNSEPSFSSGQTGNTPKFSGESKVNEKIEENKVKAKVSGFFQPGGKVGRKVQIEDENVPDILAEDEFEIDGMGEVWEYAGHSANVNNKEDSESDSDEFDPHAVVKVIRKPKLENSNPEAPKNLEIPKNELKVPEGKPKGKRVDLKTRKLMAEAKIQQASMKNPAKIPEFQEKEPEVIVNVSNEWDNISVREIEEVKTEKIHKDIEYFNRNICVNDVLQTIESIKVEVPAPPKKSFFRGLFSCFRLKSKDRSLIAGQKQRIQLFSQQNFDKMNNMHVSMLKKIYKLLRNIDNCPLVGEHWREIGFQGKSPETDLRKVGLYGLFCILYFVEKYPSFSGKIHKASLEPNKHFPFAAVCINFSEVSLNALDQNILLKEIEKTERVYEVLLDYFCGLMVYWFGYFIENKKNVMDVMKTKDLVEAFGAINVNEILSTVRIKV